MTSLRKQNHLKSLFQPQSFARFNFSGGHFWYYRIRDPSHQALFLQRLFGWSLNFFPYFTQESLLSKRPPYRRTLLEKQRLTSLRSDVR